MKENFTNITINDFNNIQISSPHIFSAGYEKEKKRMIASIPTGKRPLSLIKAAVAAIILITLIPTCVYAVGKYFGFFNGAWGGGGRESHDEYSTPAADPNDKPIQHAAVEYADVDEETAENILEPTVEELPFSVDMNGTQLTVTSIVKDNLGNAVVEYKLEREGGLIMDEQDGKGLSNASSDYSFSIGFGLADIGGGYAFKDEERSTNEVWYCYDYILKDDSRYYDYIDHTTKTLNSWLDYSYEELKSTYEADGIKFGEDEYKEYLDNINTELESLKNPPDKDSLVIRYTTISEQAETNTVSLSLSEKTLDTKIYDIDDPSMDDPENTHIEISPISIRISGLHDEVSSIVITYNDGTSYIVFDDKYINTYNSAYKYDGNGDGEQDFDTLQCMFNRLVNIEEIVSIQVDGMNFIPKEQSQ